MTSSATSARTSVRTLHVLPRVNGGATSHGRRVAVLGVGTSALGFRLALPAHRRGRRAAVHFGVLLLSGLLACTGKPRAALPTSGPPAPEFAAPTLDSKRLALEDLRGSVVLVNVWATWCGPCRDELPVLQKLHEELKSEGLRIVGVSTDATRNKDRVQAMAQDYGLNYPIMLDPQSDSLRLFKIDGLPTSVLIDRQGAIRWRRTGVIEPADPEFDSMVQALLSEEVP